MHKPGVVPLRPLGLGDFFDGAFKTIRRNPRAMVGLAALVTTAFMVVPVLVTLALAAARPRCARTSRSTAGGLGGVERARRRRGTAASYLGAFFGLFATVVLNGMLVRVVAEAVLGPAHDDRARRGRPPAGRMRRLVGLMLLDVRRRRAC